jgi:hypothetical protein
MDTISRSDFLTLLEAQFFHSIVEATFAFGFLKISIALSLLRLSRGSWYNRILWGLIGTTPCASQLDDLLTKGQQALPAFTPSSHSSRF